MGKPTKFNALLYQLLDERLRTVENGGTPTFTDMRHMFYECRNKFLKKYLELTEIDLEGDQYSGFEHAITYWCQKYCREHGMNEELYWRVREMLNIWAKGKATCEGEVEKFLIEKNTRERVSKSCSFILLCEKETVSRELMKRLQGEGYKLNIVATGGKSPSDVKEAVLEAVDSFDKDDPTFYFLVLHDFDIAGVEIFFDLKRHYNNVIDVGVNQEFIHSWNCNLRLVEEQVKNKGFHKKLEEYIQNSDYTQEDFNYLQGEKVSAKKWIGKRIEIDAIHVEYGIEPFVKYIVDKIQKECKLWDLSRIGVEDFELDEPDNPFEEALKEFNEDILGQVREIEEKIDEPLDTVHNLVWNVTHGFEWDIIHLKNKYGIGYNKEINKYEVSSDEMSNLERKYQDGFFREYVPDYKDELKEINDQIKRYEGDVREGKEDLENQKDDLQKDVDKSAEEDKEVKEFKDELDNFDWGKDEFEALEVPDEKDVIKAVIEKLQGRLEELEEDLSKAERRDLSQH